MAVRDAQIGFERRERMARLAQRIREELRPHATVSLKDWTEQNKVLTLRLLAYISAFWTLSQIEEDWQNQIDTIRYAKEAHAMQIVSLMILFDLHTQSEGQLRIEPLQSQFTQIKTGQGKSIVLGIAATLFALLGYEVDVVCYSAELSQRDFDSFEQVFRECGVIDKVHYGTIWTISNNIITLKGDLLTMTRNLVLRQPLQQQQIALSPRVLLIDEVDVFFSEDFYGRTYNPITLFVDQQTNIEHIMHEIWRTRSMDIQEIYSNIQAQQSYQALLQNYSYWRELFELHIKMMVRSVKRIDTHSYILEGDRIGYKAQDSVSFDTYYGYLTTFAYFQEWEHLRITTQRLSECIGINLECGNLSYAEIPQEYTKIFGVTGTLEHLPDIQKQILRQYAPKLSYAASMFSDQRLRLNTKQPIQIVAGKDEFFHSIKCFTQEVLAAGRSLLVFFRSRKALEECLSRQEYLVRSSDTYQVINEQTRYKQQLIELATRAGQITFLTREFGRGTNFRCIDQDVLKAGGVAVLQAFYSPELIEEVQIRGRAARWQEPGEYRCLALSDDIKEDFQISSIEINQLLSVSGQNLECMLAQLRQQFTLQHTTELVSNRLQANKRHTQTLEYRDRILAADTEGAKEFIRDLGIERLRTQFVTRPLHFLFVLDDSGSMMSVETEDGDGETRWEILLNALKTFYRVRKDNIELQEGQVEDVFSIIYHSTDAETICTFRPLSELEETMESNEPREGNTAYYLAVREVLRLLQQQTQEQRLMRTVVFFLSDGEDDNKIPENLLSEACQEINTNYSQQIVAWCNRNIGTNAAAGIMQRMCDWLCKCNATFGLALEENELHNELEKLADITYEQLFVSRIKF